MVTQRQGFAEEALNEELSNVDIDGTVAEAQASGGDQEAAQAVDPVDASRQEAIAQAAEAIKASQAPAEPEVVDKDYFEARLASFGESLTERMGNVFKEVAPPTKPVAPADASLTPQSIEEQALERMLRQNPTVSDDQIAHWRQQFREERANLEEEERRRNEPDRIANIERRLEEIAVNTQRFAPVQRPGQWSQDEVNAINNAIDTLGVANGIVIDRQNPTHMNAVVAGVQAGENVQSVIQKIGANVRQIQANVAQPVQQDAAQALQGGTAGIPELGTAATSNEGLVFTSEDEIRDAIALNKIDVMDYERYRAQLRR